MRRVTITRTRPDLLASLRTVVSASQEVYQLALKKAIPPAWQDHYEDSRMASLVRDQCPTFRANWNKLQLLAWSAPSVKLPPNGAKILAAREGWSGGKCGRRWAHPVGICILDKRGLGFRLRTRRGRA